jgi:hypothetical protein
MKRSIATYVVIAVLAIFGIGGITGGVVAISMVNDNLKEQGITFGEDTDWAGQQVTNGWDAYHFQGIIKEHVTAALKPAGFTTYEEVSAAARASVTYANPAGDAKLMGLRRTALDGNSCAARSSAASRGGRWAGSASPPVPPSCSSRRARSS